MTNTRDVLPKMQAEARGYKRGLREAAERVWRREWKTKCSCDHVLVKKKLDILALIPAEVPCHCTLVAQDQTCPVGYPSLLCNDCNGKG